MGINFFKGHPTPNLLPTTELAAAFKKTILGTYDDLEDDPDNRYPLGYGTDPGNEAIRETVARWSDSKFGRTKPDSEKVNLTAGSSYGAANILLACTRHDITKHVFLVSPTYFLINYAFVDAGFGGRMSAVVETPGSEYEIDLDGLEQKLTELDAANGLEPVTEKEINIFTDPTERGQRKFYRYVLYLVPTFSNPGGLTYSIATRKRLLQIARKHDMLLLSDDVYDFLNFGTANIPPKLNHIDEDTLPEGWQYGNSVSNASFLKIIAPGLRCGWQETATPHLAQQLATTGANKSAGTPNQLSTFVVKDMVESGELDQTITKLNATFKVRADATIEAMQKYLPKKHLSFYGGDGGYFIWCQISGDSLNLKETLDTLKKEHNVIIPHGFYFEVNGDEKGWGTHCARLCVAYLTPDEIDEGIQKWASILKRDHPELY